MADTVTDPTNPYHHPEHVELTIAHIEEAYKALSEEEKKQRVKKVFQMCGKATDANYFTLDNIRNTAKVAASAYATIRNWGDDMKEKQDILEKSIVRAIIIQGTDATRVKIAYFLAIVFHVGIDDAKKQEHYLKHVVRWRKARKERERVDQHKIAARPGYYWFHLEYANEHTLYNKLLEHEFTTSTEMKHLHISEGETTANKLLKQNEDTFEHPFHPVQPEKQKFGTRRNRVRMAVRT